MLLSEEQKIIKSEYYFMFVGVVALHITSIVTLDTSPVVKYGGGNIMVVFEYILLYHTAEKWTNGDNVLRHFDLQ